MDDTALRIVVVIVVVAAALVLSRLTRPLQDSAHPPLTIPAGELPAGIVLFTSTDCDRCAAARAVLQKRGVHYREVTWELEGSRMERYGVQGVPLLARITNSGEVTFLAAGVPTRRSLRSIARP